MDSQNLKSEALTLLDEALAMKMGLTEDDSDYTLSFIGEKLALCSRYSERLSDISILLTQMAIGVNSKLADTKSLVKLTEAEKKSSKDYKELPREEKTAWLVLQLQACTKEHEEWNDCARTLASVKEAVTDRVQTMRRLDSDLRLQHKLLEAKVEQGAMPSPGRRGDPAEEVDLTG